MFVFPQNKQEFRRDSHYVWHTEFIFLDCLTKEAFLTRPVPIAS